MKRGWTKVEKNYITSLLKTIEDFIELDFNDNGTINLAYRDNKVLNDDERIMFRRSEIREQISILISSYGVVDRHHSQYNTKPNYIFRFVLESRKRR